MNRENLDLIEKHSVDDAVALHNNLPNILSADFRDNAPRKWKLDQTLRGSKNALRHDFSVSRSVARDEEKNCIKVIQRLFCPGYLSHRAIRRRASSWETF